MNREDEHEHEWEAAGIAVLNEQRTEGMQVITDVRVLVAQSCRCGVVRSVAAPAPDVDIVAWTISQRMTAPALLGAMPRG